MGQGHDHFCFSSLCMPEAETFLKPFFWKTSEFSRKICGCFARKAFFFEEQLNFFARRSFFGKHLRVVSLVLGLGLEHSCPWPREGRSSESRSLALASDFFCVLGLELCVLDSTSLVMIATLFRLLSGKLKTGYSELPKLLVFKDLSFVNPAFKVTNLQRYGYFVDCFILFKRCLFILQISL